MASDRRFVAELGRANRQPALAAYLPVDGNRCRGYGIMVLDVAEDGVRAITGFPEAELFPVFELPADHLPRHEPRDEQKGRQR